MCYKKGEFMEIKGFKTQKGYDLERKEKITFAMEDYIEMIYRLEEETTKITTLANLLNIKPSSVSKMIDKLKDLNLVDKEKYGSISLTQEGKILGSYLLNRHNILCRFFKKINGYENLYLVEQIEHFFDKQTIKNIEKFLDKENIND